MQMYDIILKKRNGEALTKEEIYYFIDCYTKDTIPDYQVSALLMAIYFQKMNDEETAYITEAMMNSGEIIDLSMIEGIKVDKHSTGGVGDKTTIALGPIIAACGVPVAKMSGRGLGHTGGTIDKLESIPGFSVNISKEDFINNVNKIKFAITAQTNNLAPADKKLYSLRDVTGTVENISLIASSIMSKKLALGTNAIVLDVKTGNGAFMKNIDDSFLLAKKMVNIGTKMDRKTIALITDMNQPLGYAIGNALEVKEVIDLLNSNGPEDLKELCIALGSQMLILAKKAETKELAREMIEDVINSGAALNIFKEFVKQQGGDLSYIENPELLVKVQDVFTLKSDTTGYINEIKADIVGECTLLLGAGRTLIESKIDLSVGLVLNKKVGDYVKKGEDLAYIYSNDTIKRDQCINKLKSAYIIKEDMPILRPLILGIVTKDNTKKFKK
ncbi:MAG: pyrimidine-nucleoside phosphorylase [Clostridiales bacterium]|nr:pyrimidine-nucleoside phosphorylase [Clostridiales bacterium]